MQEPDKAAPWRTKLGTKNDPGKFDCYHKAAPDEPMFVLLARDPLAAPLVRIWAARAAPNTDPEKIAEAKMCAAAMDQWRLDTK